MKNGFQREDEEKPLKTHFLLIGFSCTGKTSLGERAFGEEVIDSDKELLKWVCEQKQQHCNHIYEIYMWLGRDPAISLIEEAERALIDKWEMETKPLIISLGPGFPFHDNWDKLRDKSYVVLFRRSPQGIYESLKQRRDDIFKCCPKAKEFDNWDVDVIVDKDRQEFSEEVAIGNIQKLLDERESAYRKNDAEVVTDNALQKLIELKRAFGSGRP